MPQHGNIHVPNFFQRCKFASFSKKKKKKNRKSSLENCQERPKQDFPGLPFPHAHALPMAVRFREMLERVNFMTPRGVQLDSISTCIFFSISSDIVVSSTRLTTSNDFYIAIDPLESSSYSGRTRLSSFSFSSVFSSLSLFTICLLHWLDK